MTRTRLFLITGLAVSAVAVIVVGVLVVGMVLRCVAPTPETQDLPDHALTPEESITEVAPHMDGTVAVRQRLVFEAPPEGEDSVGLWFVSEGLGRNPVSGHRLAMMPVVDELTAVELSTDAGSTRRSPQEAGDLDVDVETVREKDFDYPRAHFSLRPKDSQGRAARWDEGRHIVEVDYVLDKVFLTVSGREFIALPLSFIGAPRATEATHTMIVDTDGPLACPANNVDFALNDCADDFAQIDDDGTEGTTRMTWREDNDFDHDVVVIDPPENMSARPIHPTERS
ncbi:hypothetical protein [Brevibacterium atlanticum]|uniref:hypothetical protein n=1 Tax=Brevibacterium atlanticum TaxID=2697563 RepID=UPI00141FAD08|nr:hypothetical protein [Brevibacterium atlanticum]